MSTVAMEEAGFTMIELLVSMAIFSFMLLIITSGVLNIVRLQNESLAANASQDNARSAMDQLVEAVRDSTGVVSPTAIGAPAGTMCLASSSGAQQAYYVNAGVLYRSDDCASYTNTVALTNNQVAVSQFTATVETGGPAITEPEVKIDLTVASNNSSTNAAQDTCLTDQADRQYCSVIKLTSGAVPR